MKNSDSEEENYQGQSLIDEGKFLMIKLINFIENEVDLVNNKPTIIFFHGNSGNIGNRLDFIKSYIAFAGVNVLIGKDVSVSFLMVSWISRILKFIR